jgi:guanylate cyclase
MEKCWDTNIQQRPTIKYIRKVTDAVMRMQVLHRINQRAGFSSGSLVDQMIKMMEQYANNLEELVRERTRMLEEAQAKADALLHELLPKEVASELTKGNKVVTRFPA